MDIVSAAVLASCSIVLDFTYGIITAMFKTFSECPGKFVISNAIVMMMYGMMADVMSENGTSSAIGTTLTKVFGATRSIIILPVMIAIPALAGIIGWVFVMVAMYDPI